MHDVSTYSVSSDRVSDSYSELGCLGSPYVYTHTYIHATCKRHVEKGYTRTVNSTVGVKKV